MNRWLGVIALGAAMLSMLAGCGGGAAGSDSPPPAAAASPQTAKAAAQNFTGNGTYWNPQESGTGFVFEAQADAGVVAFFVFDTQGKPVWYMASGAFAAQANGGYSFSGMLQRYAGGQPASSTVPKVPTATPEGTVSIQFSGDNASVQLPGRSYTAQRFNPSNQGSPATASQPETGIYWNAGQSGRGYTIEVRDNVMTVGVFHYDADGAPTWNLVVAPIGAQGSANGAFNAYSGGQTLNGPYVPPQGPVSAGVFGATFTHPCKGLVQLPGVAGIEVTRFPFGGLPAGAECRASANAAQVNYNTALKCPNSFNVSGAVVPNATTQFERNGVTLAFKLPSSGALNVKLCADRYLPDPGLPASLQALIGRDPITGLNAAVFADGEFDALIDKQISFNMIFVGGGSGPGSLIERTHIAAYTQDAAGAWQKAILPTTRTLGAVLQSPGTTAPSQVVLFKAAISKPGFYGTELLP